MEADLDVQTNVHLKIQLGKFTHALSLESLQTCPRWLRISALKIRVYTQEHILRLAKSKKTSWLWLLLTWDSTIILTSDL